MQNTFAIFVTVTPAVITFYFMDVQLSTNSEIAKQMRRFKTEIIKQMFIK